MGITEIITVLAKTNYADVNDSMFVCFFIAEWQLTALSADYLDYTCYISIYNHNGHVVVATGLLSTPLWWVVV